MSLASPGTWSTEEENLLIDYVHQFETKTSRITMHFFCIKCHPLYTVVQ